MKRRTKRILIRHASVTLLVGGLIALIAYFYGTEFSRWLSFTEPFGHAVASLLIVFTAAMASATFSYLFYRDMMYGLLRSLRKARKKSKRHFALSQMVAHELRQSPSFNDLLRNHLKRVVAETEKAAFDICAHLQEIDQVANDLNRFVEQTLHKNANLASEIEERLAKNQKMILEMEGYIAKRFQEADADHQRVLIVVDQARFKKASAWVKPCDSLPKAPQCAM